jgi:hypothetical protein
MAVLFIPTTTAQSRTPRKQALWTVILPKEHT